MPVIVDVAKPTASEASTDKKKRRQKRKRASGAVTEKLPKLDTLGVVRDYETKEDVEARTRLNFSH